MQDYDATEESTPVLTSRATSVWYSVALFAIALVVSAPDYTGLRSHTLAVAYRFGLPALWGVLAFATTRIERLTPVRPVLLSLCSSTSATCAPSSSERPGRCGVRF